VGYQGSHQRNAGEKGGGGVVTFPQCLAKVPSPKRGIGEGRYSTGSRGDTSYYQKVKKSGTEEGLSFRSTIRPVSTALKSSRSLRWHWRETETHLGCSSQMARGRGLLKREGSTTMVENSTSYQRALAGSLIEAVKATAHRGKTTQRMEMREERVGVMFT